MKVAIFKPDHLGDLILSSPAIRAVLDRYSDAVLFVAGNNLELARGLFGREVDVREANFPHLTKNADKAGVGQLDLRAFDVVVFLRNDGIITPDWAGLRCRDYIFPVDTHADHQSVIDYAVLTRLVGHYDIDGLFYGDRLESVRAKASRLPASVGLCIGSGFHANTWPIVRWVTLGQTLLNLGLSLRVICGPKECEVASLIAGKLGLGLSGVLAGGKRFAEFIASVAELDWIVASDGGTAHLCSLAAPVISLFGASPFRRYAPFGNWNRLVTQELDCSPCCQWTSRLVNGCLSTECMAGIDVADVMVALAPPFAQDIPPGRMGSSRSCSLYFGVSHIDRAKKQSARLT